MAAAPVDTAVGVDKIHEVKVLGENTPPICQTFKRVSQHYATNNNPSTTPSVTIVTNAASGNPVIPFASYFYAVFEQGYYNLPFTSTTMAVDIAEWDAIQLSCSKFRVKGCGFRIFDIAVSQNTATTVGGATTINNQFVSQPTIILVKDNDHILSSNGTISDVTTQPPSTVGNLLVAPGHANNGIPHTFSTGLLPQIQWLQPAALGTVSLDPETGFELLKGGDLRFMHPGDEYSYHWENPDKDRWLGPQITSNDPVLQDETQRNTGFYSPGNPGSITAAIMQNLGTDVQQNLKAVPCGHFLRIPPLYTEIDAITVSMTFWVEYHMEIEWLSGKYLNTRNIAGSNSTVIGQMLPFPVYKRNLLAYSATNPPLPTLQQQNKKKPDQDKRKASVDQSVPDRSKKPRDAVDGPPKRKRYISVETDNEEDD